MVYDQLLAAGENWRARWVVVVRRQYIEETLTTLNTFFLRHGIILNSRGVIGYAEKAGEIWRDPTAFQDGRRLAESIIWLLQKVAR